MGRKPLLAALALLAIFGIVTFVFLSRGAGRPRIDRDVCDRIRRGMSLEEAEAVIGAPPGDYSSVLSPPWIRKLVSFNQRMLGSCAWIGDEHAIVVTLDAAGAVEGASLWTFSDPDASLFERLKFWFRRP